METDRLLARPLLASRMPEVHSQRRISRANLNGLRSSVVKVDYRATRSLDRALFLKLASRDWIRAQYNLLITGPRRRRQELARPRAPTEGLQREDLSVAYHRVPRLFQALALACADGRYARILRQITRVDLLILDDWGPALSQYLPHRTQRREPPEEQAP